MPYRILSVNRHSNPLKKEGYLGKKITLSQCVYGRTPLTNPSRLRIQNDIGHRATHSYRTSKFPVFIICPVYDEVRTHQLTISGFLKFKVCIIP